MKLSSLKQQIEELDAKATKGPWLVHRDEKDKEYTGLYLQTDEAGPYSIAEWIGYTPGEESDFNFIALSRTALPELLRRLLVAEEALKLFAADSSWYINGVCDPNSGRFEGQTIATAALKTIRGEEE